MNQNSTSSWNHSRSELELPLLSSHHSDEVHILNSAFCADIGYLFIAGFGTVRPSLLSNDDTTSVSASAMTHGSAQFFRGFTHSGCRFVTS